MNENGEANNHAHVVECPSLHPSMLSNKWSLWNLATEWIQVNLCHFSGIKSIISQVLNQAKDLSDEIFSSWVIHLKLKWMMFQSCLWNTPECAVCNLKTERKRILIWIRKGVQIWATSPFTAGSANTATCRKEYSLHCKQLIYLQCIFMLTFTNVVYAGFTTWKSVPNADNKDEFVVQAF